MNRIAMACVVSLVAVSQARAQDTGGAAPNTQTSSMNVQMTPPGGPSMQFNMQVQTQAPTPQAMQAPQPQAEAAPDCGAGPDNDCLATRRGRSPMDAESFRGFLQALKSNPNELEREDIAKSTLGDGYLTAKQLGLVLGLFENEITRYEVAEVAAPKLVKPKHALGLASKFDNSITASDFTKLIAKQRD